MQRILDKIKHYDTIIIHGHQRPDGDCYGSQFGLKDIITMSFPRKHVYVVGQKSDFVDFVGKIDEIGDEVYQGALSIVVDTAVQERISDQRYTLGKEIIKIDHHIPIDNYGNIRWVDTSFPSCAQMIAYFYTRFQDELKLSKTGAIALYTGIVTDTGRFRFRGVSKLTHQLAGMLIDKGVEVETIDRYLSTETLDMVKFKGYVYSNFILDEGIAYIKITRKVIEEYHLTDEQAASMVSLIGGIEGYPIYVLFMEGKVEIRVRIRSTGPDIDQLANMYHGGGHKKAAGAKLKTWDELPQFILDAKRVLQGNKEYEL